MPTNDLHPATAKAGHAQENSAPTDPDRSHALTFVEQKIDQWYTDQPGWLRAFAFGLFLMLFSFAFVKLFSSQYTVRGMLKEKLGNGRTQAAKGYEVRLASDSESFGANFRGFYYAVIGPAEYFSLMLSGSTKVVVRTAANEEFPERDLHFNRLYGSFDSLDLDLPAIRPDVPPTPHAQSWYRSLFPVASAAEVPGKQTKLVLYDSYVKRDVAKADEGQFKFHINGNTYEPLSAGTKGRPAGAIPLSAGETFQYGGDYYVSVPKQSTRALTGTIDLDIDNGYSLGPVRLGGYSEKFPVSIDALHYGKLQVQGNNGSRITLLNCQPYTITVFEKQDLRAVEPAIKELLALNGFCVVPKAAPQGPSSQTNSAYLGKRLPFDKAQQILTAFISGGVRFKYIEANMSLPNNDDAQIGGWTKCEDKPILPDAALKAVLTAASDAAFQAAVQALPSCGNVRPPETAERSNRGSLQQREGIPRQLRSAQKK